MYIVYDNTLYDLEDEENHYELITRHKAKTDKNFYPHYEVYVKEISTTDLKIQEIYDVDFYVVYHDTSKTVEIVTKEIKQYMEAGACIHNSMLDIVLNHIWNVNEGKPIYSFPKIENNEVALDLNGESHSDDWIMDKDNRSFCSKIVNINDCERLFVRYTYTVKNGRQLEEKEVVEVTMEPEDFKAEMLKYRLENI